MTLIICNDSRLEIISKFFLNHSAINWTTIFSLSDTSFWCELLSSIAWRELWFWSQFYRIYSVLLLVFHNKTSSIFTPCVSFFKPLFYRKQIVFKSMLVGMCCVTKCIRTRVLGQSRWMLLQVFQKNMSWIKKERQVVLSLVVFDIINYTDRFSLIGRR